MRRLASACLIALLWGAGAVHAGEVRVTARRDGDAVLVEASADLHADRQIAWKVLTDYDHYAEFVPDLRSSRILARSSATAIVEQTGVAGMFFYHFPMEVRLAVTEEPFDTVRCQAISGNFREMSGVYKLEPTADGVRFLYDGRLVPAFRLPPLIGLPAVRASVERQFRGLVQEIERRAAAAAAAEPAAQ